MVVWCTVATELEREAANDVAWRDERLSLRLIRDAPPGGSRKWIIPGRQQAIQLLPNELPHQSLNNAKIGHQSRRFKPFTSLLCRLLAFFTATLLPIGPQLILRQDPFEVSISHLGQP